MNFNNYRADVINRINVGSRHKVKSVELNVTKSTMEIIKVLLELGLIRGFNFISHNKVIVNLRYYMGRPVFYKLCIISKPSKRVFWNLHQLYKEVDKQNAVIYVISTKKGLFIGSECLWRSLSGEVLFKILL